MASERLPEALELYVNSDDWEEARRIVKENKELLSDDAINLLAESVAGYRAQERNDIADYLQEHRAVLDRAREVGVDQALDEANARAAAALEARQRQLADLRTPEPTPVQSLVWQLLDAQDTQEIDRILSEHADELRSEEAVSYMDELIRRARESGLSEAVRYLRDYHELLRAYYELPPLMLELQQFMSVPTWTEARDILNEHPDLLSDEAMQIVDSLMAEARAQDDQQAINTLQIYRQVLQRAREVGPDLAIEEVTQPVEQPS